MELLQRTRKINKLLQEHKGLAVDFKEMADYLGSAMQSNVFILSRRESY